VEALEHQRKEKYSSNYFRKYNPSYFKRLLLAGASPNAKSTSGGGTRALQYAVESGDIKICELLVENGANPNLKDNIGLTSLHSAVYHKKTKICKILVENGADVDAKDKNGETPLEMAKRHKHTDIVKILKAARAKKAGST
jgi:ankyrin repeat protein